MNRILFLALTLAAGAGIPSPRRRPSLATARIACGDSCARVDCSPHGAGEVRGASFGSAAATSLAAQDRRRSTPSRTWRPRS